MSPSNDASRWRRLPIRMGGILLCSAALALAANVLLFAAFMKWKQLPAIAHLGTGFLYHPLFAAAQITGESALALWLLSGLLPLWSRRAAIAAFSLFAIVTAYQALTGADSCGCFGQFKVNPYLTLALDLTIVLALALTTKPEVTTEYTEHTEKRKPIPHLPRPFRPFRVFRVFRGRNSSVLSVSSAPSAVKTIPIDSLRLNGSEICENRPKSVDKTPRSPHWRLAFLIAGMAIALSLTLWRMPTRAASPAHAGITFASGLAILEPETWPGQPLPILDYLQEDKSDPDASGRSTKSEMENGYAGRTPPPNLPHGGGETTSNWKSEIGNGNWQMVIYSNDCDHCRQLIPSLLQQAPSAPSSLRRSVAPSLPQSAFIELPPYAQPGQSLVPAAPGRLRLQLTNQHEWFAQTPILLHTQNGRVTTVKQGPDLTLSPKDPS